MILSRYGYIFHEQKSESRFSSTAGKSSRDSEKPILCMHR